MTAMLTLQRRHSKKCPDRNKGPNYLRCRGHCPVRVCGIAEGRRVRVSLKTRDLQRAARRLAELEDRQSGKPRKTVADAVEAFHAQHMDNASETKRKYRRILSLFGDFCASHSVLYLDQVNVEAMDRYALWRSKTNWTWIKEIELLRQFFDFCRDREWTSKNPAKSLRRPILKEANDIVPYTQNEIVKIIAACDQIGRSSYERRRARAMVLLMRYAGLRISDVVTLSRDHIRGHRLEKRAVKNHRMIRVELPDVVLAALDLLPQPQAAAQDNRRFFSKDSAVLRSLVKGAWRTMDAVFQRSGVARAHCHRFRHTLASELLGKGGTMEEVAAILGDSPTTIRRYYAKWTEEYQSRQDNLIRKIHGTDLAQTEAQVRTC
jgi:site-specific recombinase XerD